jgi:beta-xylosidase
MRTLTLYCIILSAVLIFLANCSLPQGTNGVKNGIFVENTGNILKAVTGQSTGNPFIKNLYTADVAAMVYNGTCYIYTGHDEAAAGGTTYVMKNWRCFSSTDMLNWTDRGTPLAISAFSWVKSDAWAGQVIAHNGKFYWYAPMNPTDGSGFAIGVAVSSSPTGPFTDALGKPLITNSMTKQTSITWDDIDPTVFIDDNGQAYLYWGNTVCKYVKLNSDMISITGSITAVSLPSFTESPYLTKHGSTYYLSYAYGFPESIAYATSSSAAGPWTYRGIIMTPTKTCGTNHQALVDFNGKSYFLYHNGALPTGGDYRRSVCMEYMYYNSDGTIQAVLQTSTGIWGTINRIQSYNNPTMYVRHQNFDVRIDANVSPLSDSQWQIMKGLANSSGYISFQSVSYPGYYLRHSNYDFVLAKNDGTALFAQDSTFKEVAGLKDSTWSSFQSYNYTTRYIRHSNYLLRIDPISTDAEKQDSTFKITN